DVAVLEVGEVRTPGRAVAGVVGDSPQTLAGLDRLTVDEHRKERPAAGVVEVVGGPADRDGQRYLGPVLRGDDVDPVVVAEGEPVHGAAGRGGSQCQSEGEALHAGVPAVVSAPERSM